MMQVPHFFALVVRKTANMAYAANTANCRGRKDGPLRALNFGSDAVSGQGNVRRKKVTVHAIPGINEDLVV